MTFSFHLESETAVLEDFSSNLGLTNITRNFSIDCKGAKWSPLSYFFNYSRNTLIFCYVVTDLLYFVVLGLLDGNIHNVQRPHWKECLPFRLDGNEHGAEQVKWDWRISVHVPHACETWTRILQEVLQCSLRWLYHSSLVNARKVTIWNNLLTIHQIASCLCIKSTENGKEKMYLTAKWKYIVDLHVDSQ